METITLNRKVLYTAKVHTEGGRSHGTAKSSDGHLDIILSSPGTGGKGTNPEQLLAAGWSSCFEEAMKIVAAKKKITLPEGPLIDAEIDLCMGKDGLSLTGRFLVTIPQLDRELAEELIDDTRKACPYSKALEANVPVEFTLV